MHDETSKWQASVYAKKKDNAYSSEAKRRATQEDAIAAERAAKAKAHIEYRRALMRAHSTTVLINKKYRPAILRRRKDEEGTER